MFITTISLSYVFLGIGIISLIFFIYFQSLSAKVNSPNNEKIIGKMKNKDEWALVNTRAKYVSLLWFILSIICFVYLKFFYTATVISIFYLIGYVSVIALSIALIFAGKKVEA